MSCINCNQCEYEKNCSLCAIAPELLGCNGHGKLHHRYEEEKKRLMKEAERQEAETSLKNKEILEKLKPGDRVQFIGSPKSYTGTSRLPEYLNNGILTVIGIAKNGNVKCDWDKGKPFNIPPKCLRICLKGEDKNE